MSGNYPDGVNQQVFDEAHDQMDDEYDRCPTCRGEGTVNPLTAPKGHFCVGVEDCPDCDGTGKI